MSCDFSYPFTQEEMERASSEWGCNCGPSALAFAAKAKLEDVRHVIPGFDEKRYTSPMMMKAAIANLHKDFRSILRFGPGETPSLSGSIGLLDFGAIALVRVQWTGPWTAPGANPKWAYRQTHWIAAWRFHYGHAELDPFAVVFDCNGGIRSLVSWQEEIAPILTSGIERADGGYYPTHVWRLNA